MSTIYMCTETKINYSVDLTEGGVALMIILSTMHPCIYRHNTYHLCCVCMCVAYVVCLCI